MTQGYHGVVTDVSSLSIAYLLEVTGIIPSVSPLQFNFDYLKLVNTCIIYGQLIALIRLPVDPNSDATGH